MDAHGPTHHNQAIDLSNIWKLVARPETGSENRMPVFFQPRLDAAEPFKINMLKPLRKLRLIAKSR